MNRANDPVPATAGRLAGLYIIAWLVVIGILSFLYLAARTTVINEVRHQAMGVAIATAAGLDAADLEAVRAPGDSEKEAFLRVQGFLRTISKANPDVRYIYTMRRSRQGKAGVGDYEYIVDQPPEDENGNGVIDPDEDTEAPGNYYDAWEYPAMIRAWKQPDADTEITPDPPYPDMLSGYAPVRDRDGRTAAIVGVDIIASTISDKLLLLRITIVVSAAFAGVLVSVSIFFYGRQKRALIENRALARELKERNELLRAANDKLSAHNEQFRQELRLAQSVQLGFLPATFPHQDHVTFEKAYLTCEILGGDLYDVFEIDDRHLGIYIADVAGHGVTAALISSLLKMAVESVRGTGARGHSGWGEVVMEPAVFLQRLNAMLLKEIPEFEFITMIYAVFSIEDRSFLAANAGHLYPYHLRKEGAAVAAWDLPTGGALGLFEDAQFEAHALSAAVGDKIVFYTDGLTEAMSAEAEEFGEERFERLLEECADLAPGDLISRVSAAVEAHRAGCEVSDDFTLLVAEVT